MKRAHWLAIVGLLLVSFTLGFVTVVKATPTQAEVYELEDAAWQVTCFFLKVDCSNVPQPVVAYTEQKDTWGEYEYGTAYVSINKEIWGTKFSATVMVHEYTHYIQFIQRKFEGTWISHEGMCATEKEAFDTQYAAVVAAYIQNDPRVTTWDEIKDEYGCK